MIVLCVHTINTATSRDRELSYNTHGENELELSANRAEPKNQAELVPGPDPDKIKNFKFFFTKNQT